MLSERARSEAEIISRCTSVEAVDVACEAERDEEDPSAILPEDFPSGFNTLYADVGIHFALKFFRCSSIEHCTGIRDAGSNIVDAQLLL